MNAQARDASSGRPRRGFIERRVFWPLAALLTLACVELAYRATSILQRTPFDHEHMKVELGMIRRENRLLGKDLARRRDPMAAPPSAQLHPFFGFDSLEGRQQLERQIDAMRDPQNKTFDVLLIGGDLAVQLGAQGAVALGARIEKGKAAAGKRVNVWTYARAEHKQPQQLTMLLYLGALGVKPDAVISIGGPADVAASVINQKNGTHPSYPSRFVWESLVESPLAGRESIDVLIEAAARQDEVEALCIAIGTSPACRSAIVADLRRAELDRACVARDEAMERLRERRKSDRDDVALRGLRVDPPGGNGRLRDAMEMWMRATRAMEAVCRQRSIQALHVIEPTTLIPEFVNPNDDVELQIARCYQIVRGAAGVLGSEGLDVFDPRDELPDDAFDETHRVNRSGLAELIDRIAARLETTH